MMELQMRSSRLFPAPPALSGRGASESPAGASSKGVPGLGLARPLTKPDANVKELERLRPVAGDAAALVRGMRSGLPAAEPSPGAPSPSGAFSVSSWRSFGMSCSAHICTMMPRCRRVTRVRLSGLSPPSLPPFLPPAPPGVSVKLKERPLLPWPGRITVPKGFDSVMTERMGDEMDAGRKPDSVSDDAAASEYRNSRRSCVACRYLGENSTRMHRS
mmetsp:Transcript_5707/g.16020  ORF Transcript_5707/g.16020 Transcript_5707/m.16020 type:complete len:217 (-) Transcript_5707:504-1154(-)